MLRFLLNALEALSICFDFAVSGFSLTGASKHSNARCRTDGEVVCLGGQARLFELLYLCQ